MQRQITFFLLLFYSFAIHAQDFSSLWEGHFSYYNIKDLTQGNGKIYAASENALFSYDILTNELQTITTVDGLSGETITTIHYSEPFDLLVVGYENGLMEIISFSDDEVLSVVDILEKETISPTAKRINHFNEYNGLIYIATDYGISVYDLQRLEFGDTYFIGSGGNQIIVKQTTIFQDQIYAACFGNNAIKTASVSNPNLIDFQQWQTLNNGNFVSVQSVADQLYAVKSNNTIYRIVNGNFNSVFTYADVPLDTRAVNNDLVITTRNQVFAYDSNFNLLSSATVNQMFPTQFTAATITEEHIYIGTTDFGVLQTLFSSPGDYEVIRPDGPLTNKAFKIQAANSSLWVTYGDYTVSYDPSPFRQFGLSHLVDEQWNNIPYDSLLMARNLNYVAVNPFEPSQVFISSYEDGILEINDEVATVLLNESNSGLESLILPGAPNFKSIRQGGSQFDRSGLMWTVTGRVDKALKSFNPSTGAWQGYSLSEIIPNALLDELGFGDLVIDRNGTKWLAGFFNGAVGYNENGNKINKVSTMDQNMPSSVVTALAIDDRNQLWIGTLKGLRVLYNTSGFFDVEEPQVNEIVILEDGIPKELLSNQFITDIKVDGSNNKWIGTLSSGVFYFSPDGQETIYHFTQNNSPLPSDAVTDISIDFQSGKVYIATDKGLVAFLAGGSGTSDVLSDAFVYPNPVRPEYNLLGSDDLNNINNGVKIKGLTENVNIKITDIEGNLVAEAQSRVNLRSSRAGYNFAIDGGTAIWNGKNLGNNVVASGVYLIMISDLESFETKILKLLIIR